jgi:hypothetical protein
MTALNIRSTAASRKEKPAWESLFAPVLERQCEPRCLISLVKAIRVRVRNSQSFVYAARIIFGGDTLIFGLDIASTVEPITYEAERIRHEMIDELEERCHDPRWNPKTEPHNRTGPCRHMTVASSEDASGKSNH